MPEPARRLACCAGGGLAARTLLFLCRAAHRLGGSAAAGGLEALRQCARRLRDLDLCLACLGSPRGRGRRGVRQVQLRRQIGDGQLSLPHRQIIGLCHLDLHPAPRRTRQQDPQHRAIQPRLQ
ncbi:Hpt domain-containing protein [Gemmobacter lanyuensis]